MLEIDITTLLQKEATQNQYIFNFVWMNLVFIVAYFNRNRKTPLFFTWLLILIFVLYAFWDTDYFSFRYIFHTSLEGFRDPFYYYISLISFNSYTIFRLLIWGTALLLFVKSTKQLNIPTNITAFIFAVFYLLSFSVGRISLGICSYFLGLTLLVNPGRNKMLQTISGILLIAASYWGHRAMMVPIVLTPLILIKPQKWQIVAFMVIGIVVGRFASSFLTGLIAGDIAINSGTAAEEALLDYATNENELVMNWKFALTSKLRWYSIYLLIGYSAWMCFFSRKRMQIAPYIKRITIHSFGIFILAANLLIFDTIGANEIGERLLLILCVPMILVLSYLRKTNICSPKMLIFLLFPAFLYAEGFIFGKILSFY